LSLNVLTGAKQKCEENRGA